MKNNKNYVLSTNIDEKMNAIVSKIKDEIRMDMYQLRIGIHSLKLQYW